MSTEGNPVRAAAYQRISEIQRAGDEHGVLNQLADQERTAEARGYQIVLTERDNDISAFTGKHRPGYERVMAAAERGEIDVILVFQTSRFWRDREEAACAKGIRLLREAGVSIIATRGPSLDLTTAYGRMMAELIGAFDTAESEIKAERQQLANYQAAVAGQPRKGSPRPFGWLADRIHADPAEAEAIAYAGARAILAGGTLTGIARNWESRGLRPREAAFGPLVEHPLDAQQRAGDPRQPAQRRDLRLQGEEKGRGQWEPVLAEETWRATADILRTSPVAQAHTGRLVAARRHRVLLLRQPHRGGSSSARGLPAYRCNLETQNYRPGPHIAVKRDGPDTHIAAAVIDALSDPGAIHLLTPQAEGDAAALIDEEAVLRARLSRLGGLFAEGQISESDLVGGRARGERRLAEIAAELAGLGRVSVLAPLVTAGDVAAAWEELSLDLKRVVVDTLMTVTLYPSGRGRRKVRPRDRAAARAGHQVEGLGRRAALDRTRQPRHAPGGPGDEPEDPAEVGHDAQAERDGQPERQVHPAAAGKPHRDTHAHLTRTPAVRLSRRGQARHVHENAALRGRLPAADGVAEDNRVDQAAARPRDLGAGHRAAEHGLEVGFHAVTVPVS